jgi:hypothetical protein
MGRFNSTSVCYKTSTKDINTTQKQHKQTNKNNSLNKQNKKNDRKNAIWTKY